MTIAPYNRKAQSYFAQYQSLIFEQVYQDWLSSLGDKSGLALDVGAGSGRDSSALAERGWDVVAVEPATGLRELGQGATHDKSIHWVVHIPAHHEHPFRANVNTYSGST